MKILLVADPFIPVPPVNYGGIERIIYLLANGLVERGHSVSLIAHKESILNSNIRLISYKYDTDRFIENMSLVYKTYRNERFDIIHSFSRLLYLFPLLFLQTPKIMSYQREPTLSQIKKASFLARRKSLMFTGCSSYISNRINEVADSVPIYNMVDPKQYDFVETVTEDAPLVFLGRIEEIKGVHLAIEIARASGQKLIIAGNIPKESVEYFKKKVEPFLEDNIIEYVGEVNDVQKNIILKNAKAFLMPILWNEPFGIVMIEAMACGTPVIAMNRGAVNEVVIDAVNGYKCVSVEEMIDAVKSISKISRKKVYTDFLARFSKEVIVNEYVNLYEKLIFKNDK